MNAAGRPRHFGPHVVAIARFLRDAEFAPRETVPFMLEVDRRWPGLAFSDFATACALAEALWKAEGGCA